MKIGRAIDDMMTEGPGCLIILVILAAIIGPPILYYFIKWFHYWFP